jgi:hypothetical protein
MFSIINTGWAGILVWFSPGSQAISTLAPRSARPVRDPDALPKPSLVPAWGPFRAAAAGASGAAVAYSRTPARPSPRGSSHTQEFTVA